MEDQQARPAFNPATIELHGDEFWPLSGKPYFHVVLTKTNVRPLCQMVIPAKMHPFLPPAVIPTCLTYKSKNWEIMYLGGSYHHKKFDASWSNFVIDNDLKTGDACVFELMESNPTMLKFRVQILRGDIPLEFLDQENGLNADTAIRIL